MYSSPRTLFTAGFMGNNNRTPGQVVEIRGEDAQITAEGLTLWGRAKPSAVAGKPGVGLIRLENVRLAEGAGENRMQPDLTPSIFLPDNWEHAFHLAPLTLPPSTP